MGAKHISRQIVGALLKTFAKGTLVMICGLLYDANYDCGLNRETRSTYLTYTLGMKQYPSHVLGLPLAAGASASDWVLLLDHHLDLSFIGFTCRNTQGYEINIFERHNQCGRLR